MLEFQCHVLLFVRVLQMIGQDRTLCGEYWRRMKNQEHNLRHQEAIVCQYKGKVDQIAMSLLHLWVDFAILGPVLIHLVSAHVRGLLHSE